MITLIKDLLKVTKDILTNMFYNIFQKTMAYYPFTLYISIYIFLRMKNYVTY